MSSLKYWEIVADKLSAAGWSWGYCSAVTRDGWRWIVDAHREGRRCGSAESQEVRFVLDHRYNFIHSNPEYARNR